jgi:hypothetical protein
VGRVLSPTTSIGQFKAMVMTAVVYDVNSPEKLLVSYWDDGDEMMIGTSQDFAGMCDYFVENPDAQKRVHVRVAKATEEAERRAMWHPCDASAQEVRTRRNEHNAQHPSPPVLCRSGYEFFSIAVSEGESRPIVFLSLNYGEKWC